jgi:DNA primase
VLLPYYYEGKIVGSTARKVREGKPKYLSDQHPFFVFNVDEQDPKNKYVFVVEGQFDAYAIGGVGLLTNEIAQQQAHIINQLGKEVIVIPDQDKAGLMLIKQAIDYGWSVAFPTWDDNVKDVADAVQKYGRLFVTVDAIKTAQQGEIKISVARNNLETRLALLEEK